MGGGGGRTLGWKEKEVVLFEDVVWYPTLKRFLVIAPGPDSNRVRSSEETGHQS